MISCIIIPQRMTNEPYWNLEVETECTLLAVQQSIRVTPGTPLASSGSARISNHSDQPGPITSQTNPISSIGTSANRLQQILMCCNRLQKIWLTVLQTTLCTLNAHSVANCLAIALNQTTSHSPESPGRTRFMITQKPSSDEQS